MLQNRVSLGLSSQRDAGPSAMIPTPTSSQTTFMPGKRSSRDAFLAAVLSATAFLMTFLTIRPPNRVPVLGPGEESSPFTPSASAARTLGAASADEWRDALKAGVGAPAAAAARDASPPRRPLSPFEGRFLSSTLGVRPAAPSQAKKESLREGPRGGGGPNFPDASPEGRSSDDRGSHRAAPRRSSPLRPQDPISAAPADGGNAAQSAPRASPRPTRPEAVSRASGAAADRRAGLDLRRRPARSASLFAPVSPPVRRDRRGQVKTIRFRPPRLSLLLGPRPLRPPPSELRPPLSLAGLSARRPEIDASGSPLPPPASKLSALESIDPEVLPADRRRAAHWDEGSWHDGHARGLARDGGWVWLDKDGERWWGLAAQTSLVRHQQRWWLREQGVWCLLHQGEPWVWRRFQDWGQEGLYHPATGTEIVYSADLARAAVITPGEGAVVYEILSGRELGRIPEEFMPARRRPKAPRSLTLP